MTVQTRQEEIITSPLVPAPYRVLLTASAFVPQRREAGEWKCLQKYWYAFRYTSFAGALKRIQADRHERGEDGPPDPLDDYQI